MTLRPLQFHCTLGRVVHGAGPQTLDNRNPKRSVMQNAVGSDGGVSTERLGYVGRLDATPDVHVIDPASLAALRRALSTSQIPASQDDKLCALVESWRACARARYRCADLTNDPEGRRAMNSAAMIYFNCSEELTAALNESSPPLPPTP